MKTNSLILKIGMVAAVIGTFEYLGCAQQTNVFSLNVVGYINVPITTGYNFVGNQLGNGNNWLASVIPTAPLGTTAHFWSDQTFLPSVYEEDGLGGTNWSVPDYDLSPGNGVVLWSTSTWTLTLVGEVSQGALSNPIPGNNYLSLKTSMVPQQLPLSGEDTNSLSFPKIDGASVYFFRESTQAFSDAYTYCGGFGWFDPNGLITTNGPIPMVGQCFFVQNPGPATNWIRNFVVTKSALLSKQMAAKTTTALAVRGITVSSGMITLNILNSSGGPYNVQFSTDRLTWKTVATNQTKAAWTEQCPGGARGFYQVVNP